MVPGVIVYVRPVSSSVSSASPSTQTTASMWFAYHIDVSVPAYRIVSCSEKPTLSLARTMRLLSQVPDADLTCRSVPSMSLNERTITVLRCLLDWRFFFGPTVRRSDGLPVRRSPVRRGRGR